MLRDCARFSVLIVPAPLQLLLSLHCTALHRAAHQFDCGFCSRSIRRTAVLSQLISLSNSYLLLLVVVISWRWNVNTRRCSYQTNSTNRRAQHKYIVACTLLIAAIALCNLLQERRLCLPLLLLLLLLLLSRR